MAWGNESEITHLIVQHRFSLSVLVLLTFVVYRSPLTCFRRFYPCKWRPEVVLSARWCLNRFCGVGLGFISGNFWKFSSILYPSNVIGHFRLCYEFGFILPLKQTFVNLTFEMTPSPIFFWAHIVCLAEMRISSQQAFWSVSSLPRYASKRLIWKSPLTSRKRGVFGGNSNRMRYIDGTPKGTSFAHPWPKLRRLMHNHYSLLER